MRIPFDSVSLAAVVSELEPWTGAVVDRVWQPDDLTLVLGLYGGQERGEAMFLVSAHAELFRAHFVTKRPAKAPVALPLFLVAKARMTGTTLDAVVQIEGDRVLELQFGNGTRLVAELMGKHSNVVLLDEQFKVIGLLKTVGAGKSVRPVVPGKPYVLPPVLGQGEPWSPFFKKLLAADPDVMTLLKERRWTPTVFEGEGAYPLPLLAIGREGTPKASFSMALETFYEARTFLEDFDHRQQALLKELDHVLLSRQAALREVHEAVAQGGNSPLWQSYGDLILAFGFHATKGNEVEGYNAEGEVVKVEIHPDLTVQENAQRYFTRAKKAKQRAAVLQLQESRLAEEIAQLEDLIGKTHSATMIEEVDDLRAVADRHLWSQKKAQPTKKEDRPFDGKRVRETTGPGGVRILYGENSEANDYLTQRVARPNDIWLHIRGGTSAHVVIQTGNHPEKVAHEAVLFAAKLAVAHSPQKHSKFVAVDYTLKKYVSKPRNAPSGTALYTREKTVHVDSDL